MYDAHCLGRLNCAERSCAPWVQLASAWRLAALGVWLAMLLVNSTAAPAADLPGAEEVLARVAERAKLAGQRSVGYEFTRTKQTKVSDETGKVEKAEVEVYRMVPIGGKHCERLISRNGKPPTPEESARQQTGERKHREKANGSQGGQQDSMFKFLDKETANRFSYEVVGQEQMRGRPAYVLSIRPRRDLKARGIEEKIMARLEGRLWVDVEEAEVVRIETHLTTPFRFLMGVLAVLHDFQFSVQRQRLANGEWANAGLHLKIHFRQLFQTKRVDYEESGSDFTLLPAG